MLQANNPRHAYVRMICTTVCVECMVVDPLSFAGFSLSNLCCRFAPTFTYIAVFSRGYEARNLSAPANHVNLHSGSCADHPTAGGAGGAGLASHKQLANSKTPIYEYVT